MENPITNDPRFKAAMLMIQLGQEQAQHLQTEYALKQASAHIDALEAEIQAAKAKKASRKKSVEPSEQL